MERHGNKFFTIWYGVYDRSQRRLAFSGGGHPPALMLSGRSADQRRIQELAPPGPVIGLGMPIPFENVLVDVPDFASLLLYSDGAVELVKTDGSIGEQEEFVGFVSEQTDWDDIMDRILARARALCGESALADDCSLLQLSFQPPR